jgi:hypothetical protein
MKIGTRLAEWYPRVVPIMQKIGKLRALPPQWDMYQEGIDLNMVQWAMH